MFFSLQPEDMLSGPVRAPPTESPEVELDEYSGHLTPTEEAHQEMHLRGGEGRFTMHLSYHLMAVQGNNWWALDLTRPVTMSTVIGFSLCIDQSYLSFTGWYCWLNTSYIPTWLTLLKPHWLILLVSLVPLSGPHQTEEPEMSGDVSNSSDVTCLKTWCPLSI